MPRIARYSSSRPRPEGGGERRRGAPDQPDAGSEATRDDVPATTPAHPPPEAASPGTRRMHPAWVLVSLLLVLNLASVGYLAFLHRPPAPVAMTQKDIDAAVLQTLSTHTLPSPAARAAAKIAPSVVHVSGFVRTKRGTEIERGEGTGVVVVDKGLILTNLHVVQGSRRIEVEFADGSVSDARVVTVQAENDLAVLQALDVPENLKAATMRSTEALNAGDQVIAVGFPFGIGPSVSSGVVSGLQREFQSPEGKQVLRNLIQFDAAANPGNSGGPLVTMDGEVVGIVTAILNPTSARTSLGIGFAVPIENAASALGSPPF